MQKIDETKSWFCEMTSKIFNPLTRVIQRKKQKQRNQISNIKNKRAEVTNDYTKLLWKIYMPKNYRQSGPDWCSSADWVSSQKAKGHWFNSWSAHMPGLQAPSPAGVHMRGNQ